MRLIDADALANDLEHDVELDSRALDDTTIVGSVREEIQFDKDCKQNCIWYLTEAPTIEERRKGRWINAYPDIEPNPMFMYGICSICGFEQSISDKLNFCPNCGSDMRGEQK